MTTGPAERSALAAQLARYPLLEALKDRRSRRFAAGMHLNGGPLAFVSGQQPVPLTRDEEAALAFAACGVTGHALADLPYRSGDAHESGSGNMMGQFVGRTVASADAMHVVIVFVLNDDGAWLLRRPQDFPRGDSAGLIRQARAGELTPLYERSRVRLATTRPDVPRQHPYVPAFNKWSANVPGTTYFLPVAELTAFYINLLLTAFNEEFGYYIVDERNGYRPAGLGAFARSRGGHLHDDAKLGRFATLGFMETWAYEFAAIEQGGILQNLGLMTQALGLGGFPHFAAHPFIWFASLGFRMQDIPLSRVLGAGRVRRQLMRWLGKDMPVPTATGLERDGIVLIRPFCPPWYRNMEEAVHALVAFKWGGGTGTFRDGGRATAWKDGAAVQAGIPEPSERAIAATIAHCDYVYRRYGRFPANSGPFRTILAYQAHNLDTAFYERFYRPDALGATQHARLSGNPAPAGSVGST